MKNTGTLVLAGILIILVAIKILIPSGSEQPQKQITQTTQQGETFYYPDKNPDGAYHFSLKYVVLFDDASSPLVSGLKTSFEDRISLFDEFIEKESLGRIRSNTSLEFVNVKSTGMKSLSYNKPIFDWINLFYNKYPPKSYNMLVFVPIYGMDWCKDGLSQGFNYNGKVFFCMEEFFNPESPEENRGAIGLMTHKILHSYGFNHQDQVYKQYALIDWYMGLPETNILLHGNFREFDHSFLDEHTLKILGIINRTEVESSCLDRNGLICRSADTYFCEDSWGPACQDIDSDGIADDKDNYVFSSPKIGNDSDQDGIIDELDLCGWNKITPSGADIAAGPIKIRAQKSLARISFTGDQVRIKRAVFEPSEIIGGFIRFNEKKAIKTEGDTILVNKVESSLWRIKVFYDYDGTEYFRPFYVYFKGFDADFLYEKEWYYFSRFGCDIPTSVNFSQTDSYDEDLNGLPDEKLVKIDEKYDWDDDKTPDLKDTLPTVKGNCSDAVVKGVKDSDNDGFCDPGMLDFRVAGEELSMVVIYGEKTDRCPYIYGKASGCP